MIVNEISVDNKRIILTWTDSEKNNIKPITQVWAFCFNKKGEILIGRKSKDHNWNLPGGTPEKNETPEQTLHREANEEMSVILENLKPLGHQKVEFPDGKDEWAKKRFPDLKDGKALYQLRYFAIIKKMKKQDLDPASGFLWERKFIKPEEFTTYFKWGNIGDHLAMKAKEFFDKQKKEK